ncbi:MAG: DMT family transporter [Alphaproteobacteria bacterium]|nr:DMT family transporter [Alphaproteobacteria bacterium]
MTEPAKTANLAGAGSLTLPVLICTLGIFILSGMDAAMKSLVIAIGVYNTVMWRSVLATATAGAIWLSGARSWPTAAVLRLHALRAVIIGIILILFFWGLARVPLAEAIGLSFIAPLIALYLAALLLGERIRRQIIWASLSGIVGVAIIIAGQFGQLDYSQDVVLGSMAVLASTVFYAYNLILSRRQAILATPAEIMFFQNLTLVVILLLPAPWLAAVPAGDLWLPLAGATALSLGGQFLMIWAYARAEAQYLIPTEYSAFIWAIAFGWYFFDEVAGWTTVVGAGLIIAACLIAARTK